MVFDDGGVWVRTENGGGLSSAARSVRRTGLALTVSTCMLVLSSALLAAGPAMAVTETFSLATLDKKARLGGQADIADGSSRIVILVAGTGAFDRNVKLGRSGGEADQVFLDLSRRLNAAGVTAVRYDKRGVVCAPVGPTCIDEATLATTTAASGAEDVATVYAWVRAWRPDACIAVLAHSEGMLQAARAIESGAISPVALFGFGALMESPVSAMRWQRIDRIPDSLLLVDRDADGVTTNAEIEAFGATTPAAVFGDMKAFASPSGSYSRDDLERVRKAWSEIYERERKEALEADPASAYRLGGRTVASYDWWRQWFTDETPVAARLKRFNGPVRLLYGAIDSQTPPARQARAIDAQLANRDVTTRVFADLGHTLGRNVFLGPIDGEAGQVLVSQVATTLDGACKAGRAP